MTEIMILQTRRLDTRALEATSRVPRHFYEGRGWETAVSYIDPKNLHSIRLAERLGAGREPDAAAVDGTDACNRYPAPATPKSSRTAHGIEMEIQNDIDPLFKPRGWALD